MADIITVQSTLQRLHEGRHGDIDARYLGSDNQISATDRALVRAWNELFELDQSRGLKLIELTGWHEFEYTWQEARADIAAALKAIGEDRNTQVADSVIRQTRALIERFERDPSKGAVYPVAAFAVDHAHLPWLSRQHALEEDHWAYSSKFHL